MVDVLTALPEIVDIEDDALRDAVRDCWALACEETGVETLSSVPWLPPVQREFGIEDETLVGHTRDVVAAARALADSLEQSRGVAVDSDQLVAGALVHDVSKLYEFDGMTDTPVCELLGHPYYGVHCVARVGLPVEYSHIVLSHTSRTAVEPAFLEAELIRRADEAAAAAIRLTEVSDLRDAR